MVETELQTEDTRIQRNLIISRKIREKERERASWKWWQ